MKVNAKTTVMDLNILPDFDFTGFVKKSAVICFAIAHELIDAFFLEDFPAACGARAPGSNLALLELTGSHVFFQTIAADGELKTFITGQPVLSDSPVMSAS